MPDEVLPNFPEKRLDVKVEEIFQRKSFRSDDKSLRNPVRIKVFEFLEPRQVVGPAAFHLDGNERLTLFEDIIAFLPLVISPVEQFEIVQDGPVRQIGIRRRGSAILESRICRCFRSNIYFINYVLQIYKIYFTKQQNVD